jgi:hypothetical protein
LALEGVSLTEPSAVDKPGTVPGLDLSKIEVLIFVGDWSVNPVDLTISAVSVVPPTNEVLAQRVKLHQRLASEAKAAAGRKTIRGISSRTAKWWTTARKRCTGWWTKNGPKSG